MFMPIITVYARAVEGEGVIASETARRVDARCSETEAVCMTKIRRIGTYGPSVTVDARVPQTAVIDIDAAAAKAFRMTL